MALLGLISRSFSRSFSTNLSFRVGSILDRPPVITKDLIPFEEAYYDHASQIEKEKTKSFSPESLKYFDFQFVPQDEFVLYAPRVTEADQLNDKKSLNRALQRTLYLIVRQDGVWKFPSIRVNDGELLNQTAEKIVQESFGGQLFDEKVTDKNKLRFWRPNNEPSGVFVPENEEQKVKYDRTFFYNLSYLSGEMQMNNKSIQDYLWITKDEAPEYLEKPYLEQVEPMLAF